MNSEEFENFNKKIRSEGIVMSRVPTLTREEFIRLSEYEFSSDYGLTLCFILKEALEYRKIKEMLFNNKLKIVFEK